MAKTNQQVDNREKNLDLDWLVVEPTPLKNMSQNFKMGIFHPKKG